MPAPTPTPACPRFKPINAAVCPVPRGVHTAPWARLAAVLGALTCVGLLALAAGLEPDARGLGTHEQLGLGACGYLQTTGMPCATCGMTTSFSLAADGRLLAAFAAQPLGAVLAWLTAVSAIVLAYAAVSGMSLAPLGRSLARPGVLATGLALLIAAWGYKTLAHLGLIGVL